MAKIVLEKTAWGPVTLSGSDDLVMGILARQEGDISSILASRTKKYPIMKAPKADDVLLKRVYRKKAPFTTGQILKESDFSTATVSKFLANLVDKGVITKMNKGVFLPPGMKKSEVKDDDLPVIRRRRKKPGRPKIKKEREKKPLATEKILEAAKMQSKVWSPSDLRKFLRLGGSTVAKGLADLRKEGKVKTLGKGKYSLT